jgi:hypothetical protein
MIRDGPLLVLAVESDGGVFTGDIGVKDDGIGILAPSDNKLYQV